MPEFTSSVQRSPNEKWGERPSALDFIPQLQHGAIRSGSSTTDVTSWIQDGLDALASAGGGMLYLPWGVYPVMDLNVPANVFLQGDGSARTILKRIGNLPAGRGVLNFAGAKSGCSELAIDGQVTTPATALYSSLSDPSAALLSANSSVRIHPGASDITLFRCRIFHTGGYAVHIDARTANVYRIEIIQPHLHDNRSFLFGATVGNEIYGSWTGGILAQGDGLTNNYGVRGLTVRDGRFRRGTGNQVWSHLYGFGTLHTDFKIQGCTFEDIGRDGVMLGGVVGGDVAGNFFRRIGYICADDISAGVPRWINGQWAVGLDTAGLTRGVSYRGNSFVSCYGAAMDLDGFAEGIVSDNTVIVPTVGEPEYTEDAIASWAANYCYGAQTSNTNNLAGAAVGVRVTGNRFRNCGLGAIRMYASRRGSVAGNTIEHPAAAAIAPIVLGNIGSGANQRAYANTITENDIHYSPSSPVAVVQEDPNGFNFQAGDVNRVFGNRLHGTNIFEFFRHSSSGSRTAQEFASAKSGLTAESKNILQREDGYWRTYWVEAGASKVVSTLIDRVSLPASAFGGPLHNVSVDGVGGVFSTGSRTTSAFDDAMLSSKIYADGFLAIAATTFSAADANVLADTVGLIRYNASTKIFEQSTSVSAGARVWTPLSPQALSGLTAGRVPYTTGAAAIADTANLAWNNSGRVLTVTGATGTASIVAATSFIQSQEGFLTTSGSSTAVNVLSGGVSALSLISVRNDGAAGLNLIRNSGANQRSFGIGVNTSGQLFVSDETAAATRIIVDSNGFMGLGTPNPRRKLDVFGGGICITDPGGASRIIHWGDSDTGIFPIGIQGNATSGQCYLAFLTNTFGNSLSEQMRITSSGNVLVATTSDDGSGAKLQINSFIRAVTGFATPATATDAIQAPSGGVTARFLIGTRSLTLTADTAVNAGLSGSAQGRIYFDSGTNKFRVSENGGAYVDLLSATGVTSLTGTTNQVNVSASTGAVTLSLPQNIHSGASPTFSGLSLSGVLYSTGSVGINAPSPQCALDVRRTGTPGNTLILQTLFNTESSYQVNSGSGLLFQYGGGQTQAMISAHIETNFSGNNGYLSLRTTTDGGATLPERVRITAAGNVLVNLTTDDGSGARLQVNGFIRPTTGLATPSANTDAIQAPSGGVTARFLIGTRSLTMTADTAANAGLSGSAQGRIYFDSGTNKFRVSENGGAYVDLLTAAGVTSLAGTANQVNASASTGAVTLSLPQSIHTGATPQFAGLGVGMAASGLPLLIFGQASSEVARFQGRNDVSNNRNFVSFYTTNPGYWWELSNQDASGGGTTNGLAFRERSGSGASVERLFLASGGNVIIGTTTDDGSGARLQVNGFARAITGFATPASATDALQAPTGGVTARFLIGTRSLTLTGDSAANAGLSGSAQGRIYFDSGTNKFRVSENGGAYVDLLSATGVTSLTGTTNQVNVSASTGAITLSLPQSIHTGASPTFGGMTVASNTGTTIRSVPNVISVVEGAFAAASSRFMLRNTSATSNGAHIELDGPTARWVIGQDISANGSNNLFFYDRIAGTSRFWIDGNGRIGIGTTSVTSIGSNAPLIEVVGSTRTTWGHGQNALFIFPAANNGAGTGDAGLYQWISEPGSTWTGAGIGRNMYNATGFPRVNTVLGSQMMRFGEFDDITYTVETAAGVRYDSMRLVQDRLLVATHADDTSGAKLQINGFARAITGFATPATATDAIQAPSGGVTARFLIGTRSLTMTADTAANAGLSGSAQGRIYFDSSTNKFRVSENGGAYVDLLSATGVTSLTGTANQVNVSASTGAVTLSLPQSIHTGASPTFAGVTAGAFSSTATGTAIAFQTSNFNFQVNGNGVVSSAGGINVAGSTVIDSSRNATNLASATASGVFQSQASGSSIAFQTTNFNFQVNGNGVVSSAGGINVAGSTVINTSGQFVGLGINMPSYGVAASGFNPYSGLQYFGQTLTSWIIISALRDNGGTKEYKFRTVDFRGGVITSISAESAWTAF